MEENHGIGTCDWGLQQHRGKQGVARRMTGENGQSVTEREKSTSHSHIAQEDYLGLCATERKQDLTGLCLQDAKLSI